MIFLYATIVLDDTSVTFTRPFLSRTDAYYKHNAVGLPDFVLIFRHEKAKEL